MEKHEMQTEECPEFADWKGRLGWTFTAEECCEEWQAKRDAEKFMENYFTRPLYVTRMYSRAFKASLLAGANRRSRKT